MTQQIILVKRKIRRLSTLLAIAALSACQTETPFSEAPGPEQLLEDTAAQVSSTIPRWM